MRPQTTIPQKTNITSFATIAVVVAFVAWLMLSAARQDSLFARAPQTTPVAAALAGPTASAQTPPRRPPAEARERTSNAIHPKSTAAGDTDRLPR